METDSSIDNIFNDIDIDRTVLSFSIPVDLFISLLLSLFRNFIFVIIGISYTHTHTPLFCMHCKKVHSSYGWSIVQLIPNTLFLLLTNIQNNILYEDKLQHNNKPNIFCEKKNQHNNQNNIFCKKKNQHNNQSNIL